VEPNQSPAAPPRKGRTSTRTRLITKIIVSLLLGLIAFLLAQVLDNKGGASGLVLGIGGSVFVSGVAFVAQFLIDVADRLDALGYRIDDLGSNLARAENIIERRHAENQEMINSGFLRINTATELFGAVEASALKTDAMTQLVKNSTSVGKGKPSLVFDFAQAEIGRLSGYLKDLGQGGDVTYEGEDRDWLLGLTRVAAVTIDATSLSTVDAGGRGFVDGGLWNSDLGQQYLDAQREAIARGVAVRRIFIVDRPELEINDDFIGVIREHTKIGVQVRTLKPDDLAGTRRSSLIDFIVIDGVLSYQATPASRSPGRPPTIASTTLVTNPVRIAERIERYKALWAAAAPVDDVEPPDDV
jgi:hypothetical protein